MQRAVVSFHQDDDGVWAADLECGHTRHVRHEPPFQNRPWILTEEGRRRFLGQPIECRLCDSEPTSEPGI